MYEHLKPKDPVEKSGKIPILLSSPLSAPIISQNLLGKSAKRKDDSETDFFIRRIQRMVKIGSRENRNKKSSTSLTKPNTASSSGRRRSSVIEEPSKIVPLQKSYRTYRKDSNLLEEVINARKLGQEPLSP